jgi:hypothetical protein
MKRRGISTVSTLSPRFLKTTPAARYCGVSPSYLRKLRLLGPADPQMKGPTFTRLTKYLIVYDVKDLDAWLDNHRVKTDRGQSTARPLRVTV